MKTQLELRRAEVLKMLNLLPEDDLLQIAKDAVAKGCNDQKIIEILALGSTGASNINALFEFYRTHYESNSIDVLSALRLYAKEISEMILSGALSPREGSNLIWRAHINSKIEHFHDLDGFIYAASEMDDRPEDHEIFEDGIVKEARRIINTY